MPRCRTRPRREGGEAKKWGDRGTRIRLFLFFVLERAVRSPDLQQSQALHKTRMNCSGSSSGKETGDGARQQYSGELYVGGRVRSRVMGKQKERIHS